MGVDDRESVEELFNGYELYNNKRRKETKRLYQLVA